MKIWNIDQCRVHWQSVAQTSPCILAVFDLHARIVVSAYRNGDIILYRNVELDTGIVDAQEDMVFQTPGIDVAAQSPSLPDKLFLAASSPDTPAILTHFNGDSYAWRITFDLEGRTVEAARLDGPIAPLTTLECDFSSTQNGIIYGGDALGQVHAWSWSATGEQNRDGHLHVPAIINWDTEDGLPVSVIRPNGTVVLTGNWRGGIKVWDALMFRLLRVFKTPQPKPTGQSTWEPVSNLVLDADMLVASVGKYVMHWKAGPVSVSQPWKKTKKIVSQSSIGKGWRGVSLCRSGSSPLMSIFIEFSEMQRAIKESQAELETTARTVPRVSTTAQEQMEALQKLGLQETEAVEYALMLSHEEALKAGVLTNSASEDSGEDRRSQKGSISTSTSPRSTSLRTSPPLHASGKVQIARLEPMSIGGLPSPTKTISRATSAEEFPTINMSTSPGRSTPVGANTANKKGSCISDSPDYSPPAAGQVTPPAPSKPATSSWSAIVKSSRHDTEKDRKRKKHSAITQRRLPPPINDEAAQLQFALDLSLAEAVSEGSRDG